MATRPADTASTTDLNEVFYPESDGMPLPDGEFQAPLYREVLSIFEMYYEDSPGTHVNGNTFLYYEEGNPRRFVSPDCYVVFDISMEPIERYNTYRVWEMGKPPDFVLEIGSPSTATTDLVAKRELYAQMGIEEYWRFDSTGGDFYREPLVGEHLVDGEYRRLELEREPGGLVRSHSPVLGLDLCWDNGHLRAYNPATDKWLLSSRDVSKLAREERAGQPRKNGLPDSQKPADEERAARVSAEAIADEERAARQSAEARLAEMEAELRRLRGE